MISVFQDPVFGGLFGDGAIQTLWTPDAQIGHYRAFEAALAGALADTGHVPAATGKAAAEIVMTAPVDIPALAAGTARDGLPIPSFVRQLRAAAGNCAEAIHTGATSQDVLDTALSLTLRDVSGILRDRLETLDNHLSALMEPWGNVPLTGRTRMQAALPITTRDRVRTWQSPLQAHLDTVKQRHTTEPLQLGGPVGTRDTFAGDAETIAALMAKTLGLVNTPCWHTDRSGIVAYGTLLSLITGALGKMGQDIALMAQQGIYEIRLSGGGTSSAMPHKANPVLAELLITLARFNAAQVAGLHHALVHEQERSGAAWTLEWMILPQMTAATGRALTAAIELIAQIERMGRQTDQDQPASTTIV